MILSFLLLTRSSRKNENGLPFLEFNATKRQGPHELVFRQHRDKDASRVVDLNRTGVINARCQRMCPIGVQDTGLLRQVLLENLWQLSMKLTSCQDQCATCAAAFA